MLIPKDSKDLKAFREFLNQQRTQACSTASVFKGPLKVAMDDLVAKIDAWLSKLPSDEAKDNWCLDNQLDSVFNLLAQASACASIASLELAKATNGEQLASAVTAEIAKRVAAGELYPKGTPGTPGTEASQAATDAAVSAAIQKKLEAGELVAKERLTQLCADSRLAGVGEGEKKVRDEIAAAEAEAKLITARKASVQAASLPLPEAELEKIVLGGTDEQFNARVATFKARQEALKTEGYQLNADGALANLWLDDAAYKGFEKLVKSMPQLKFAANPLATAPGAGNETKGTNGTNVLVF